MSRQLGRPASVLIVVGSSCVVLGGLVAAVTRPLHLEHGSWLAAYLVLVGGVAQIAMGLAPLWLTGRPPTPKLSWSTLASWDLGNVLVIAGTLGGLPLAVDGGSMLLAIGLATAWYSVRNADQHASLRGHARPGYLGWAYKGLLLVLLVSIPIGVVLAHMAAGGG